LHDTFTALIEVCQFTFDYEWCFEEIGRMKSLSELRLYFFISESGKDKVVKIK
jgi:hypothetical protein